VSAEISGCAPDLSPRNLRPRSREAVSAPRERMTIGLYGRRRPPPRDTTASHGPKRSLAGGGASILPGLRRDAGTAGLPIRNVIDGALPFVGQTDSSDIPIPDLVRQGVEHGSARQPLGPPPCRRSSNSASKNGGARRVDEKVPETRRDPLGDAVQGAVRAATEAVLTNFMSSVGRGKRQVGLVTPHHDQQPDRLNSRNEGVGESGVGVNVVACKGPRRRPARR